MSCEGYEHNSPVVLASMIPGLSIPVGAKGLVVEVNREAHKMDVNFVEYGLFRDLDAHSFQPFTGGEGNSSSGMMSG